MLSMHVSIIVDWTEPVSGVSGQVTSDCGYNSIADVPTDMHEHGLGN